MANTFTVTLTFSSSPDAAAQEGVSSTTLSDTITLTGPDFSTGTQVIGTGAEETLAFNTTDIGTAGPVVIKNLDSTNFVTINSDAGATNKTIRLNAGEFTFFRLGSANTTLNLQADTGAVTVQYWVWET